MAQFDVHRVRGGGLVIDCQADLLASLPTRFVVPLRVSDDSIMRRLNPAFTIDGLEYAMITQLAGSIDAHDIGEHVVSLTEHEYVIKSALDMLISGF